MSTDTEHEITTSNTDGVMGVHVEGVVNAKEGDLLSQEQLQRYAHDLAVSHKIVEHMHHDLLHKLERQENQIQDMIQRLSDRSLSRDRVPPAGEWLLDNSHIILDQIRLARKHLPKSYSKQLPVIALHVNIAQRAANAQHGDIAQRGKEAVPRVYALATEYINHVDGRLDSGNLMAFFGAYQEHAVLTIGELWAVPIALRLALIHAVERVCFSIRGHLLSQARAERWAERVLASTESPARDMILIVSELAHDGEDLTPSFVAEFTRRTHGQHVSVGIINSWLESRLHAQGETTASVVQRDHQSRAADQVTMASAIGSMRLLDSIDWSEFVEHASHVEQILRRDPANCYENMDFQTRDHYRHIVEDLGRHSRLSESAIAEIVLALAQAKPAQSREGHVGWWLLGDGINELQAKAKAHRSFHERAAGALRSLGLWAYLFPALIVCVAAGGGVAWWLNENSTWPLWASVTVGLLIMLASTGPVLSIIQRSILAMLPPQPMSRLNYRFGIPDDARTVVAVPCMLAKPSDVDRLLEQMEIRYLANRDNNITYILLSDFRDADQAVIDTDEELLRYAGQAVSQLNEKYSADGDPFGILHRPRKWNDKQGVWMGWERKRGKLDDLNKLLLHNGADSFNLSVVNSERLNGIRYVIVLDADTQLPPGTAQRLIGAIAHPLNQPHIDSIKKIVTSGHAIIQPGVAITTQSALASRYAALQSGDPGIDPYTRAFSDCYQDLFERGSFVGKGIYDLQAFDTVLHDRFPENRILSHDLIEGNYLRSGLDSATTVLEDNPARYLADLARRHRWIRGDWQVARWIFPAVPAATGRQPNALGWLERWKLADNLRRSLATCAWLLALVSSFVLPWSLGQILQIALIGLWFSPVLFQSLLAISHGPKELPFGIWFIELVRGFLRGCQQSVLELAWLPHEARLTADAVIRTLWRLWVSGRALLEWTTAADTERNSATSVSGVVQVMWIGPMLAIILVGCALYYNYTSPVLFSVAALWLFSGFIAAWMSAGIRDGSKALSAQERQDFQILARQSYAYFEDFCGAKYGYLPPDNVHLDLGPAIAHRTSPTNIGLKLLADLGARDLGYVGIGALLERIGGTLRRMDTMERYKGHFLNWYDTRTGLPLAPRYVSTVDSGNLVGHLLVLSQGLRELRKQPIWTPQIVASLSLTWQIISKILTPQKEIIGNHIGHINEIIDGIVAQPDRIPNLDIFGRLLGHIHAIITEAPQAADGWLQRLTGQISSVYEDVRQLGLADKAQNDSLVTLQQLALEDQYGSEYAQTIIALTDELAKLSDECADADFGFLLDATRGQFTIGYHVDEHRSDRSCYDLLASEARLASYVAIAHRQVPHEHWFRLGRPITDTGNGRSLVSWSGSMFEFLMPSLVMPNTDKTLLAETCHSVIARQQSYARGRGIPWGISESGYHLTDKELVYQYRAFGIPGLGFKRGLSDDVVVAPYASLMAAAIAPHAVHSNLQRLIADGAECTYGFVEAIDYTPTRIPPGQDRAVVRQVMVHHQGMAFLALVQLLAHSPMQRRFRADPSLRAVELLLEERIPRLATPVNPNASETETANSPLRDGGMSLRIVKDPKKREEVALLGNGRYQVMIDAGGGGWSRWRDIALTRWREDVTVNDYGLFVYMRDLDFGSTWSVPSQPVGMEAERQEAIFTQGRAEFRSINHGLECHAEIAVSPEDDIEVRRIRIRNNGRRPRRIEVTTYTEVVLQAQAADIAHPAFGNLFVQTEAVPQRGALLATRRGRKPGDNPPWMLQMMNPVGDNSNCSWTTERNSFIGRGHNVSMPHSIQNGVALNGAVGGVLDPIMAIRRTVIIPSEGSVIVDIVMGAADDRAKVEHLMEKYYDSRCIDRVFELAWTHAQIVLRQIGIAEQEAQRYASLAGSLIYPMTQRRAPSALLARNRRGRRGLWSYGISGDLPLVFVRIENTEHLALLRDLVRAHAWWRGNGLSVDVFVLVDDSSAYRQEMVDMVRDAIASGPYEDVLEKQSGIFVRRGDQVGDEDRTMLQALSRVVFLGRNGTLVEQIDRRVKSLDSIGRSSFVKTNRMQVSAPLAKRDDLNFRNKWGGFTRDGREYVLVLKAGERPPAPWVNVIANEHFGTLVSESGSGYTWLENSHEFRLTPWYNDPVSDRSGEAFYLRDEHTGRTWSPTPGGIGGQGNWVVRHGFGYSVFEHNEDAIASEMWTYVAIDAPVRFIVFTLRNHGTEDRRIGLVGCVEWTLGEHRHQQSPNIVTGRDAQTGALTARNHLHDDFSQRIAFLDCSEKERSVTGDRAEFVGVGRRLSDPAALSQTSLSNRIGAGYDPAGAIMTAIDLPAGQERKVVFVLGAASSTEDLQRLINRFRHPAQARKALEAVWTKWNHLLGRVHVESPDPSVNNLVNGWLMYQVISSRIWGRTGFYQSGGAFGFRDQLQDTMAAVHAAPNLAYEQIIRSAGRQFKEGDVQHWWHPPAGRGVRTHFSDDLLWLPLAITRYIEATGTSDLLEVVVPFIEGRPVSADEEGYYDQPEISNEQASLLEHGARAIDLACSRIGPHGLPLIGCGDWNDGMNLVGIHGKGESVWLAFFLADIIKKYAPLAEAHGFQDRVSQWLESSRSIMEAVEREAWDGEWYRRATMDDGRWLGSKENVECQIDSLPQSWAVMTGLGDPERARRGLAAVDNRLVRRKDKLIQLFDPPFDTGPIEPGYIKGYLPGVRENGGQYTHAALWTVMAFAHQGDVQRAWELFHMINPINHSSNTELASLYRVEPYVIAADVYGQSPHTGRGGWSWYTGSAGWCYRLVVEDLLGVRLHGNVLHVRPLLPDDWPSCAIHVRHGDTTFYHLNFQRSGSGSSVIAVEVDGVAHPNPNIDMVDDGNHHHVQIKIGGK